MTDHSARLRAELEAEWGNLMPWLERGSLDGVWWWDLGGHEYFSPRFWAILGYDPAHRGSAPDEWRGLIDPECLGPALDQYDLHLADRSHPYDLVVRYWRGPLRTDLPPECRWVYVRCRGVIVDRDGEPWRMLGVHQDVTPAQHMIARQSDRLVALEAMVVQLDARLAAYEAVP